MPSPVRPVLAVVGWAGGLLRLLPRLLKGFRGLGGFLRRRASHSRRGSRNGGGRAPKADANARRCCCCPVI